MKRFSLVFTLLFVFLSFSSFTLNEKTAEKEHVNWMTLKKVFEETRDNPKKVIVDVYTDWCGWCKKMDKESFQHPEIVEYMNENYYAVKLNAEMRETVVIDGKEYKYVQQGKYGFHELALILLENNMNFPSIVVLDEELSKLRIMAGYFELKDMDAMLHYFGDGFYDKGINESIFARNYRSKIR